MLKKLILPAAVLAAFSAAALAQAPVPQPSGGAVVKSEPGKASITEAVEVTAVVTGVNKSTRTVTLKGPKGKLVDIVCGEECRNFDQIKVGDHVVARYLQSLVLELKKPGSSAAPVTVQEAAGRAKPGAQPGAAAARQVTVLTDVVRVDPAAKIISLKGPQGNVLDLPVQNPDQFKVVKVGDKVEATYTEAMAISVEPAPKAAAKKSETKAK